MKVNAPEKIYIQPNAHDRWFEGNTPNNLFVEYIRADVLIEKAVSYIQQNWIWNTKMIDDFRNYIKENNSKI